jgi:hypothetical protein
VIRSSGRNKSGSEERQGKSGFHEDGFWLRTGLEGKDAVHRAD